MKAAPAAVPKPTSPEREPHQGYRPAEVVQQRYEGVDVCLQEEPEPLNEFELCRTEEDELFELQLEEVILQTTAKRPAVNKPAEHQHKSRAVDACPSTVLGHAAPIKPAVEHDRPVLATCTKDFFELEDLRSLVESRQFEAVEALLSRTDDISVVRGLESMLDPLLRLYLERADWTATHRLLGKM